jgi:hypothetical protein
MFSVWYSIINLESSRANLMHAALNPLGMTFTNLNRVAMYSRQFNFDLLKANRAVKCALQSFDRNFLEHRWNPINDKPILEQMKSAILQIKQHQNSFFKNSELPLLEEKIDLLVQKGIFAFKAPLKELSLPERLQIPFCYLTRLLTKQLTNILQPYIYRG